MNKCIKITAKIKVEIMESTYTGEILKETEVALCIPPGATEEQTNTAVATALKTLTDNTSIF